MEHVRAVMSVSQLEHGKTSENRISFVTPIVSACLAAANVGNRIDLSRLSFSPEASGYAQTNGLQHHLYPGVSLPPPGMASGQSYCQLAKLQNSHEVNACNEIIGSLLKNQLRNCPNSDLVAKTIGVVGELHDNVASHAYGCGFSCAQVYRGGKPKIQIAIADCGCGLNGSVRTFGQDLTDEAAILWCLERGNTTAGAGSIASDDLIGPQTVPDDCQITPFPDSVPTRSSDNHHMGEGLFRLTELVQSTGGETWIWSGNSQITCKNESRRPILQKAHWQGTAIEIEIPIRAFEQSEPAVDYNEYESLARRLKL